MSDTATQAAEVDPERSAFRKTRRTMWLKRLGIALAIAALAWGAWYVLVARNYVSTDNAYVNARLAQVTPLVAGSAIEVLVEDTQQVKAGDVLVRLDQANARIAVAQAEADLAAARRKFGQTAVAGDVAADGVLVSVLNDGNNKLDQYLGIDAELDPVDAISGTLRLELTNTVPAGEPNYIAGAFPDQVGGYGVYPGRLAVHFPAGTQLEVVEGPEATLAGPDGGSTLLATEIRVPPGETLVWELHY